MTNTSSTGGYITPIVSYNAADDAAFDLVLSGLVVGITGFPQNLVRPRWQPTPAIMPESTVDWCAIGVIDEDSECNIASIHNSVIPSTANPPDPTGDGSTTTYEYGTDEILVSFYGPNARANAKLFRNGIMIPQNRETLILQDVTLVEAPGRITVMSEIISSNTYRRADLSFKLRRTITRVWPVQNIQKVKGTIASERLETQPFASPKSVYPLEE